jgi:hypothetical protein
VLNLAAPLLVRRVETSDVSAGTLDRLEAAPQPHNMYGASGWNWNNTKLLSGNFNGDGADDIVLATTLADNEVGVHILYGGVGTPFQNSTTSLRTLPGSSGWNWKQTKLAAGMFRPGERTARWAPASITCSARPGRWSGSSPSRLTSRRGRAAARVRHRETTAPGCLHR